MGEVFQATDSLLALDQRGQGQDGHFLAEPIQLDGGWALQFKTLQSIHPLKEVHERVVRQGDNCPGESCCPEFPADGKQLDMLSLRPVDPQICAQGGGGYSLQERGAHPRYLEINFRFAESVEKPSERRKTRFISQR